MLVKSLRTIKHLNNYEWRRTFAGDATLLKSIGDKVGESSKLATIDINHVGERINLAKMLNVPLKDVKKYISCWHGEIVHDGDLVAQKTERGGLMVFEVRVTSRGMLDFSEIDKGYLTVKSSKVKTKLYAAVDGVITSIMPRKYVGIETKVLGMNLFEILGDSVDGSFLYLENIDQENLSQLDLQGKIIVTSANIMEDDLWLFSRKNIAGLIVNSISAIVLENIEKDFQLLDEELGFTLAILSGYGIIDMSIMFQKIFQKVNEGSLVRLDSRNNILVLSDNHIFSEQFLKQISLEFVQLKIGLKVKIVEGEHFGFWGKVKEIYDDKQVLIELRNGEIVRVNVNNIYAF